MGRSTSLQCNCVAVDTNAVSVMDVDHKDGIDYDAVCPEGDAFVGHLNPICGAGLPLVRVRLTDRLGVQPLARAVGDGRE